MRARQAPGAPASRRYVPLRHGRRAMCQECPCITLIYRDIPRPGRRGFSGGRRTAPPQPRAPLCRGFCPSFVCPVAEYLPALSVCKSACRNLVAAGRFLLRRPQRQPLANNRTVRILKPFKIEYFLYVPPYLTRIEDLPPPHPPRFSSAAAGAAARLFPARPAPSRPSLPLNVVDARRICPAGAAATPVACQSYCAPRQSWPPGHSMPVEPHPQKRGGQHNPRL